MLERIVEFGQNSHEALDRVLGAQDPNKQEKTEEKPTTKKVETQTKVKVTYGNSEGTKTVIKEQKQ